MMPHGSGQQHPVKAEPQEKNMSSDHTPVAAYSSEAGQRHYAEFPPVQGSDRACYPPGRTPGESSIMSNTETLLPFPLQTGWHHNALAAFNQHIVNPPSISDVSNAAPILHTLMSTGNMHIVGVGTNKTNPKNEEMQFKCYLCSLSFAGQDELASHIQTHTGKTQCKTEGVTASQQSNGWNRNKKSVQGNNTPNKCIACSVIYNSKEELRAHVKNHLKDCVKWFIDDISQTPDIDLELSDILIRTISTTGTPCSNCKVCDQSVVNLEYHIKTHIVERFEEKALSDNGKPDTEANNTAIIDIYKCGGSDVGFEDDEEFTVHTDMWSGQISMTKCDSFVGRCEEEGPSDRGKADSHANSNKTANIDIYKCGDCDLTFEGEEAFTVHRKTCKGQKSMIKCNECLKFVNNSNIKRHKRYHKKAKEGTTQCPDCKSTFKSAKLLERHLKTRSKDKFFPCEICELVFCFQRSLRDHRRTHILFKCDICHKKLTSESELVTHKLIHPSNDPRPYKCTLCNKGFKTAKSLDKHQDTHQIAKVFKCYLCEKSFQAKRYLQLHILRHDTSRNKHVCKVCQKAFPAPSGLRLHMQSHTGDWDFTCQFCGKGFTNKFKHSIHMRSHTGEKPLVCEFCGKRFTLKSTLDFHKRIHSEERPYQCEHCPKGFKHPSNLKKHIYVHLGVKPYVCHCGKAFRQSYDPVLHRRRMHKELLQSKETVQTEN